jgi:hypothetical protein
MHFTLLLEKKDHIICILVNSPEVHGGYASLGNTTAFSTNTKDGPPN